MKNPVLTGVLSTTAMTAFSYALSNAARDNWKEPELLNEFVREHRLAEKGWLLHFSMGCGWAIVYKIWRRSVGSGMLSDLVFGSASGLIAIFSWRPILNSIPSAPKHRS